METLSYWYTTTAQWWTNMNSWFFSPNQKQSHLHWSILNPFHPKTTKDKAWIESTGNTLMNSFNSDQGSNAWQTFEPKMEACSNWPNVSGQIIPSIVVILLSSFLHVVVLMLSPEFFTNPRDGVIPFNDPWMLCKVKIHVCYDVFKTSFISLFFWGLLTNY